MSREFALKTATDYAKEVPGAQKMPGNHGVRGKCIPIELNKHVPGPWHLASRVVVKTLELLLLIAGCLDRGALLEQHLQKRGVDSTLTLSENGTLAASYNGRDWSEIVDAMNGAVRDAFAGRIICFYSICKAAIVTLYAL